MHTVRPLVTRPFYWFFKKLTTSGFLLLSATLLAMIWANLFPAAYNHLWHTPISISLGDLHLSKSLLHWIDEALMTLFFFVVGLEIKREIMVGELSSVRKAILPVAGAAGGMIVPALVYAMLNMGGEGAKGWGIPMATDIAFALAILSLITKKVPFGVKIFLSALAIADDIGAVLVIALFYTTSIHWMSLGVAAFLLLGLAIANFFSVRTAVIYGLLGIGIWLAFLSAGIHATVAGVLVAFFIPARGKYDTGKFYHEAHALLERINCRNNKDCGHTILSNPDHLNAVMSIELACHNTETPLQRLEHGLHAWVTYLIVPLFAMANAGVVIDWRGLDMMMTNSITQGIILGLVIGKPLGIILFTWMASKTFNAPLGHGITWSHIFGAGCLAGIGFTMSIFITGLSFQDPILVDLAKVGIIAASLLSTGAGLLILSLSSKSR
ncbi:MAG: Na+/H+ antiporter NhaA [Desulfobulbaceae bacterium]|uniref:Na(+)/H(+) antiporter NhaA n=1 Tax=Candidatus Desulfatifera sulfidica TaxID=2841691 RepID=A0A8J6N9M8_9BACT|nr:Na+/H+ antiporter NhaA [Candidatus Desulfatifera sulfidica]